MISETNILQTDFGGKKLARIYLGKIISCSEKYTSHDVYNAEKNLTPLHVREKISLQRFGKKRFYPDLITHTPLLQPHKGWGKSGFDILVNVIH